MSRRDVVVAAAGGLLLVLAVIGIRLLSLDALAPLMVGLGGAIDLWYVGAAATIVSYLLRRRPEWRALARVLGMVGVAWVTFVVGFAILLTMIFLLVGPIGP